jgi:hypothetical protein
LKERHDAIAREEARRQAAQVAGVAVDADRKINNSTPTRGNIERWM